MENYKLRSDEVVLYKGNVLHSKGQDAQLILTNFNLVLIKKYKESLTQEIIDILEYPISEIKFYEGVPQIKTKGNLTEIYLLETEVEIEFASKIELYKFINSANKLLTGETLFQKGANKVKSIIEQVDDTLNIVQSAENIVTNIASNAVTGTVCKMLKTFARNKPK